MLIPILATIISTLLVTEVQPSVDLDFDGIPDYIEWMNKKNGIPFREDPFWGNKRINDVYDFIVVGAGPGGATVSGRLSEVENWDVLLLEAGKDETIYTDVPAFKSHLVFTDYNWGYTSRKRKGQCLASPGQRCIWPKGKGMGGGSIINFMVYTRGNKKDYDDYEKAGNPGWGYDDIFPYFLKSEKNSIEKFRNSSAHGTEGKLHVGYAPFKSELLDAFLEAGKELGYNEVDYTNNTPVGVARIQYTITKGRRCSASKAYLKPVKNRPNLHISIESHVTKVIIDPESRRAIGVEFMKNQKLRTVFVRKEVILAAGALNTPQILMLSGVGPKEHLTDLGIPVIKNLPVGENLNDRPSFTGLVFLLNETAANANQPNSFQLFKEWFVDHKGPLSLTGPEGIGYFNSKFNKEPDNHPDMEMLFAPGSILADKIFRGSLGISEEFFHEVYGSVVHHAAWSLLPMILRPKSRGRIRLKDKNPWNWPLFEHDYFQSEEDAQTMVECIKEAIRFAETKTFKQLGSRIYEMKIPGCPYPFGTDEYWRCSIKYFLYSLQHQSGTCKMGPESDPAAVVNPKLQVYGIENLRVGDASIFPQIPSGHTYAPTVVVGEKLADMIKEAWGVNNATHTTNMNIGLVEIINADRNKTVESPP